MTGHGAHVRAGGGGSSAVITQCFSEPLHKTRKLKVGQVVLTYMRSVLTEKMTKTNQSNFLSDETMCNGIFLNGFFASSGMVLSWVPVY